MPHDELRGVNVLGEVPSLFDPVRYVTHWLCCSVRVLISTRCMFDTSHTGKGHHGIHVVDGVDVDLVYVGTVDCHVVCTSVPIMFTGLLGSTVNFSGPKWVCGGPPTAII